jgi:hypothetical protein
MCRSATACRFPVDLDIAVRVCSAFRRVADKGGASGSEGDYTRPALSAAARVRSEGEDFAASFLSLKRRVRRSCAEQVEWEAKVVAAVRATVEFAATHPEKARALTIEGRRGSPDDRLPVEEVIEFFAAELGKIAPASRRAPISTDEAVVGAIVTIVRGHLLAGSSDRLDRAAPDLVYLALLPYLGVAETRGWAMALSR